MTEFQLHKSICEYIRLQYPNVLFTSSMDGLKLPIGLAKKAKQLRSGRGWPDILICFPSADYHGLFLEVKKGINEVYNSKNQFKSAHVEEQAEMMDKLGAFGYYADFVWSFDQAKYIIDKYINQYF